MCAHITPFSVCKMLCVISDVLHFRSDDIIHARENVRRDSQTHSKLLQPIISNQSQMNYYYYSSLLSSLCIRSILVRYCVRCRRRRDPKKKNNVAVRPRCSRRRKYVTYANSYVALCTITGCLLAYAMRKHTHTHFVRYSMRFGMFLFLFFG